MNKKLGLIGTAVLLAATTPAFAQDAQSDAPADAMAEPAESPATNTGVMVSPHYVGVHGLITIPDSSREIDIADISQGRGVDLFYGWQSDKNWGYEVHGFAETFETGDDLRTDFYHYGLGADLFYAFGDRTHFTPFVLVGGGMNHNDVFPNTDVDDSNDFFANAGIGFVTGPLTEVGQLRLRGEVRYFHDTFDEEADDVRIALGVELPLLKKKVVHAPPPEVRTVEIERTTGLYDSDGDGVVDEKDLCPNTPAGVRVDGDGCPLQKIINLKGVTFEYKKTRLRPDAQTILDGAVEILKRYPDMKVEVAGHTDSIASEAYNQRLSEGRAQSVMDYFIDHGIPASQLTAKGYGELEPIADNETDEGRELNRRVELRILN